MCGADNSTNLNTPLQTANNLNAPYELRINSGGTKVEFGSEVFESDTYFTGNGKSFVNNKISDIAGTDRDDIYLSERSTNSDLGNFGYAIPLENGNYTLTLHFAEIWFGATRSGPNGNGRRIFSVEMEGNTIMSNFDINQEVGTMTAVAKTYDVTVIDGTLNIDFSASVNQPKISAIEIIGKEQTPQPQEFIKRINSGGGQLTLGETIFEADNSFSGNLRTYTNSKITDIASTTNDALYFTERTTSSNSGEFEYTIPLDNRVYEVKLHFAEIYWGATNGGPGGQQKRVFNVAIEGQDELIDFDINAESGAMTAIIKSFNINVSDGELNMRFYSSINRPKLSAIEIFGEEQIAEQKVLTRINSGGSQVTEGGVTFHSDKYFLGDGKLFTNNNIQNIKNSEFDAIYKTERSTTSNNGSFGYAIPVTTGNYTIKLHFAEIWFGATGGGPNGTGKRIFEVKLEGNSILTNYDINQDVGTMAATIKTFEVAVTDGELNIDFSASVNQPKLSAFELLGDGEIIETIKFCEWNDLAESSIKRLESQSAIVNNKLYVVAGFESGLQISNETEIYNPESNTWALGAPMPVAVTHMGIAVAENDIWILAGFVGNHPGYATDKVQIYNTITNTWRQGPSLPYSRGSGTATYNNNKIHFFGGLKPDRKTDVGEHFVIDLENQNIGWQAVAPMPKPRNHLSSVAIDGIVYAIGGQYGHDNGVDDQKFLHAYNPYTDSWTRKADLPTDRSHFEPGTIVHNGKIIIVGGRNGNFFFDDITQYDPLTNTWSELCEMENALLAPVAKVIGDKLIVSNGGVNGTSIPQSSTKWIPIEPGVAPTAISLKASYIVGKEDNISVYPNPTTQIIYIDLPGNKGSVNLILTNLSGENIEELEYKPSESISLELNQPSGIYILKIKIKSGEESIHKIIKL